MRCDRLPPGKQSVGEGDKTYLNSANPAKSPYYVTVQGRGLTHIACIRRSLCENLDLCWNEFLDVYSII
jgi:hypothetical protein